MVTMAIIIIIISSSSSICYQLYAGYLQLCIRNKPCFYGIVLQL